MATANLYQITFQVSKAGTVAPGPAWQYRRELRKALVTAASPAAAIAALSNDVTLGTNEVIDVVQLSQVSVGSEGVGQVLS